MNGVFRTLLSAYEFVCDVVYPPRMTERHTRRIQPRDVCALTTPRSIACEDPRTDARVTSFLPYRHAYVQSLILETKFHRNERAIALLGLALARYLAGYVMREDTYINVCREIILVPVPLGALRRAARGYNQVEEIARMTVTALARARPYAKFTVAPDLLVRTRDTIPQMSLGRSARIQNMDGAFAVQDHVYETLNSTALFIVVDDVTTTGATLAAAAHAMRSRGIQNLHLLALAH